jgi:hypothetical protein
MLHQSIIDGCVFFVDRENMRMVMGMSDEDEFLIIYY